MITLTYAALTALTTICFLIVLVGLNAIMKRTDLNLKKRTSLLTVAAILIPLWLAFTALLAQSGFLSNWDVRPPRIPLIPLSALAFLVIINARPFFKKLLAAAPPHWIVGMQTFRIFVELCFWGLFLAGSAPEVVTFEGRNLDVLVGVSAPFVAFAMKKFNLNPRAVILWNFIGLGILGNTIFTVLTSTPGAIHRDWPGVPFTAIASWPFIWIPAFLAPLAIFLHAFSIRQNVMLIKKLTNG